MKIKTVLVGMMLVAFGVIFVGCSRKADSSLDNKTPESTQEQLASTEVIDKDPEMATGNWGPWSDWGDSKPQADEVEERTLYRFKEKNISSIEVDDVSKPIYKTEYNYSRYQNEEGTQFGPCEGTWSGIKCDVYVERGWGEQLPIIEGERWSQQLDGYFTTWEGYYYSEFTREVETGEYEKKTVDEEKWGDWSAWGTDEISTETGKIEVESKKQYRGRNRE